MFGYYSSPNSIDCIKCPYNCKSCSSIDTCLFCEDSNISFRKDVKSSDKCECMDGYFDDGKSVKCMKCSYNCKTCSDKETCTSCSVDINVNRKDIK